MDIIYSFIPHSKEVDGGRRWRKREMENERERDGESEGEEKGECGEKVRERIG